MGENRSCRFNTSRGLGLPIQFDVVFVPSALKRRLSRACTRRARGRKKAKQPAAKEKRGETVWPTRPRSSLVLRMAPPSGSHSTRSDMSTKLSPALKALLKAPHARGAALPAPPRPVSDALFDALRKSAAANGVGHQTWLTLSVRTRSRAWGQKGS